jgi:hypothetical protein
MGSLERLQLRISASNASSVISGRRERVSLFVVPDFVAQLVDAGRRIRHSL